MKTNKLVITALFVALSFIGANIKIMGTIAFDAMPGFLGALLLGPVYGGIIGALGHFLTSLTSGFPLSLPVHLVITIIMGLTMAMFALAYKSLVSKSKPLALILAIIVGVVINGPIDLLVLTPFLMPIMGRSGIFALLPVLSSVAAINAIVAVLIYKFLPRSLKEYENK